MDAPRPSRRRLAFLVGTPLAWAVLLLFHAAPDPDDLYESLRDDVTRWQVVHLGTLVFIGLIGAALYLLVRDLPGRAARISRLAIGPFVLFYGAGEAILGVATGVLVQHTNDVSAGNRTAAADAVTALWDNPISDDVLISIGGVAWVVATVAAAIAYRGAGAPMSAVVLLGLSSIAVVHAPPVGPVALVMFATAVLLLARNQRAVPAVRARAPTPAVAPRA
jgi:hypothetical protein